jgi:hypothetical protein
MKCRIYQNEINILTNYNLRHENVWGSGCIDRRILHVSSWKWVVSFTHRPLYPWRKEPPHIHWIGGRGWEGGREPVWTMWSGEKSYLYGDSNSDPSTVHPLISRYTDCALPAPVNK